MKYLKQMLCVGICGVMLAAATGCSGSLTGGKRIIRISHAQSETHPEHLGLLKFKEYVEANLGDKYEVQIFPNELLGSAQKAIELTQTGAIDFVVAGTANLETFADVYEIFSMPYLFTSEEAYHAVMNATTPIYTPDDLKGLKIRVQQSPASVKMVQAFGAAATPLSFGDVYTAIQQHVIDGAENNELALTNNKHGEVAKYFSYTKHQMVPDMLVGNLKFLNSLSDEELAVFKEAARLSTEEELSCWDDQVEEAKQIAENDMGVTFIDVDISEFSNKVSNVQQEMLDANPDIQDLYDHIQAINAEYEEGSAQ